ncbi:hypothetical protein CAD91_17555 [Salmonella enterica subsp. enterica serovar Oranienburg]|uniref:Uncharacterized protein n=3 Tax=Salmonella enterica TaxID=28901 RepID=A0A3V8Z073_SALON|nr:hypothetical protein SEEO0250_001725 [Salmonella enterica subsp. enterica serovar Oranienburg str. 0250]AYP84327.1 hypothetical protein EAE36_01735 [Salmonella enterica subsp. enterica serovar Oranienburg]EAA7342445.1 hypothetical protein [Salmonella enterica]EAA9479558.1 hypothetical protein [Salmonella enterica subsp. enterica]EAS6827697.1 hypothetical protein [Salmonella enterica subsp. enterica serovar Give]EBU7638821.1 hypothetical protein [Salmonella enterica subsp. enterica serovar B
MWRNRNGNFLPDGASLSGLQTSVSWTRHLRRTVYQTCKKTGKIPVFLYLRSRFYYWSAAGPQPPIILEIEIAGCSK